MQAQGTYLHMIWDCSPVYQFWNNIASCLSTLINDTVPVNISVLILDDLSTLHVSKMLKRAVYAGVTAAKKMVATRWKPPHDLSIRTWTLSFLDVIYMELSTARINGACEKTLDTWFNIADSLKQMLGLP